MYLILPKPVWCFTYLLSNGAIYDHVDGHILVKDPYDISDYYLVNKRLYNRFRSIEVKHLISGQII